MPWQDCYKMDEWLLKAFARKETGGIAELVPNTFDGLRAPRCMAPMSDPTMGIWLC